MSGVAAGRSTRREVSGNEKRRSFFACQQPTMTHVENIRPGDWVLLVGNRCKVCGGDHEEHVGVPYQVLAVELPFLLLLRPDGVASGLDVREWSVKRVGSRRRPGRYVRAWYDANVGCEEGRDSERATDGHPRCVRCGERLRQALVQREWRWRCPRDGCGYDGGPMEVR